MGLPAVELIAGTLLLAIRVYSLGWAWQGGDGKGRPLGWLDFARTIFRGCVLNLAIVVILAPFGWWTPIADWFVWLGLVLVGLLLGGARKAWCRQWHAALIGTGGLFLLCALTLWWPPRSEWLAGGWDPGVYQNNAIAIARRNGIQPRTDSPFAAMTVEQRRLFTLAEDDYHEAFPAVPVQLEDGVMPFYYFHLTSLWGAWLYRLGGEALLFRQATLAAWWCLPIWLALASVLGLPGRRRYLLLIPAGLAPWWWYHQAFPTTETLYLLLFSGTALIWNDRRATPGPCPWWVMWGLGLAVINHLNAALLLAIGMVFAAWWDETGTPTQRRRRYAAGYAALAAGIGWNMLWAAVTIERLQAKDNALWLILAGWALCTLAGTLLSGWNRPPRWIRWETHGVRLVLISLGALLLAGAAGAASDRIAAASLKVTQHLPVMDVPWRVLLLLIPFQGAWSSAWAGVGLITVGCLSPRQEPLARVLVVLGALVVLLLVQPGIAPIYPWALRRFFVFWMPWLMLAQTALLLGIAIRGRRSPWLAGVLAVVVLVGMYDGLKISRRAARVGDYRGLATVVQDVARRLEPNDLIIADDPRWGTPLAVAHGLDVLNGQHLWQPEFVAENDQRVELLQQWQAERDGRLLWLTSTDQGLDFYPLDWAGDTTLLFEHRFTYPTVIHSRRARTFAEQTNERTLRLFEAVPVGDSP